MRSFHEISKMVKDISESSITKSIKRGMSGWGGKNLAITGDKNKPSDMYKRVKSYDTDTLKKMQTKHTSGKSPAATQQRMINHELKKRSYGQQNEKLEKDSDDPCWKDYVQLGTKTKDGKSVPNCVPKEDVPFEKPYAVKKKDITDKSGSKHTPKSRAKHLAKMAKNKLAQKVNENLEEKLDVSMGLEKYISDFVDSDAPQFKGKTKEERRDMAIAAYYAAKKQKKAE